MSNTLIDSYSETNADSGFNLDSDYTDGSPAGQSITNLATPMAITSSKFYFRKGAGSPTGNLVAKLYAHSGVFGTSSVPTGSALATSDPIAAAGISGSLSLVEFIFSGANQYVMSASTHYVIVLDGSAVGDASNYMIYGVDSSSPTASGNFSFGITSTTWSFSSTIDMPFYVYGLVPTTTRTQTGLARITAITAKTQTGKTRITATTTKTQTGVSRITKTTTKTQTGLSRLSKTVTKTQTGKANLFLQQKKLQTGVAKILVPSTDSYTKPNIRGVVPNL